MIDRRRASIAALVALVVMPLVAPPFYVTLLDYIALASLVALGLSLLAGSAGMTSFGQAAFVGIGAYASALVTRDGSSPWIALPIVLVVTALAAAALGAVTLRLRGHFLPLATLAWGISLYYLFGTVPGLGGFTGLTGVPPLAVGGFALTDPRAFYVVAWIALLVALQGTANLLDSRIGRTIRALKGRTAVIESYGVDPARLRISVFIYAALLAALGGWLYAHLQRFVNPTPFGIGAGIEYLFMAVIGGSGGVGGVWGAVIGAAVILLSKEVLQDVLPALLGRSGQFESIVFGALMIVLLQRAPEGAWPHLARWLRKPGSESPAAAAAPAIAASSSREKDDAAAPLLAVEQIGKRFGGLVAVDDLSFTLGGGEILALIGPNGAGKSTVFDLLTGYQAPDAGAMRFRGEPITSLAPWRIGRLGVARTFQHVKLVPGMSALDNAAIGATAHGRSGLVAALLRRDRDEERQIRAIAAAMLARVGLAADAATDAAALPLGKQRLLEIARALGAQPRLLLLDEPAAGLRLQEKLALADLLRALRAEGIGILLVEHDMDFVMGLADRVVVMNFGARLAAGSPAEVQRDPAVQAAYLGTGA